MSKGMTRPIKFRFYNRHKDTGEIKISEQTLDDIEGEDSWQGTMSWRRLAMCQFTGLTDKNGTEIYEGDVVRVLYSGWISQHLGTEKQKAMSLEEYLVDISHNDTVVFDRCGFTLKQGSIHVGKHGQIEVIGNIHENPELLEDNPNDHK